VPGHATAQFKHAIGKLPIIDHDDYFHWRTSLIENDARYREVCA
jgi:hypothetical protein